MDGPSTSDREDDWDDTASLSLETDDTDDEYMDRVTYEEKGFREIKRVPVLHTVSTAIKDAIYYRTDRVKLTSSQY